MPLPQTVKSADIINSIRALNHWVKCVLDHPSEHPNLKIIVLWCDKFFFPF